MTVDGTAGPRGVGDDLDLLFGQVAAVRRLARDGSPDPRRVYDVSIRWGTALSGRLARLAYYAGRGELPAGELARYEALLGQLRDVAPVAARLGLQRPDLPERRGPRAER